ncbi:hypothetical protein Tco_0269138 [Tanacetum coccineum]
MAYSSSSSNANSKVHTCSTECEQSYANLKKLYDTQREQLGDASIEIQAYTLALKKVEAKLIGHQQNQLAYEQKIRFIKIDLDDKTDVLIYHKKLLAKATKEKEELKTKLEKWENSSKGLNKLLDSQLNANDKAGLGHDGAKESKVSETITSVSKVETSNSKTSNDKVEMPKIETVRMSEPIIEEWESDSEDDEIVVGLAHHPRTLVANIFAFTYVELQCHELRKTSHVFSLSAVTYPSVYTNNLSPAELLGADDEEISEGGIPRVIVLGYDGLSIQPLSPSSRITYQVPRGSQTPPSSSDEDEREPMFVQAHDPDYVPEPIYPEYIPLEDEHEFLAEEQPLRPVDSPIAESPGYVIKSDPEKDPEEYEDDETEDGPADYPMDEGDDVDDDDDNSSRDDANDEDEDDEDEDEDEEEHLAPAKSTIVVPIDEPVFPPENRAWAEVERLLAMTTPSLSPPVSLSPPSAGECLARITSIQALIDAVTAALPSPPLPPLPLSLYIPPPFDHRDEILESEHPPRKRDFGYGIRDTWVDPAETVPEIAPMTVGEVSYIIASRYGLAAGRFAYEGWDDSLRDGIDGGGGGLCFLRGLGSLDRIESGDSSGASDPSRQAQMVETLRVIRDMRREMSDMHAELLALREQQRRARQPGPEARIPDHQDASGDADSHI